ncbi:hypothetical protein [Actinoplanes sp. NPDC049802]|uniref:hypothetical protein n=1 Tax=Actinoplanes sp. NPDC049802 TaxID=3154742 RepID=UPI0033FA1252
MRPDITAADLITLLKSLLVTVHDNPDPGRAERILAVLTDGLRPSPATRPNTAVAATTTRPGPA